MVEQGEARLLAEVEQEFEAMVSAIEARKNQMRLDIMHRTQARAQALISQAL